jgi:uncharacterized membrane protein (UPF0127 family)
MIIGSRTFKIEVARTEKEQMKGLMFRKSLGELEGMIFVYKEYIDTAFWMENTSIPLSIAFIGKDGTILDIKDMKPFSQSRVESERTYMYALEVNQGTFKKYNIKIGDKVGLPPEFGG